MAAVCVISRRTVNNPRVLRHPKLGRLKSIEVYQTNIVDTIKGNLENHRRCWEDDIKRSTAPLENNTNGGEDSQGNKNRKTPKIWTQRSVEKLQGACVRSCQKTQVEGDITTWSLDVDLKNSLPNGAVSIHADKCCLVIKTEFSVSEITEDNVEFHEYVLLQTLRVDACGPTALKVLVSTTKHKAT